MSNAPLPVFKTWVPEWLIRLTIFLVLLPALGIFALYFSNSAETAGYYGMEPADVQYSVVIMYATLVTFLPLDDRFVRYLKPKQYFIIGVVLNTVTYLICAGSRSIPVFMVCRFVQGAVCAMFCSICLNLIFPRLQAARARAVGYSVFYGILQVSIPGCAIFCSWVLHYFDFNVLFYMLIAAELPGVVLLLLVMNNVRFRKKFPLYQVDWASYLFYTVALCTAGYIFIYGQKLNWLDNRQVWILSALTVLCLLLFILRQLHAKRPFINVRLFRFSGFRNGLLLLMAYYIFKGTTGFTYAYLQGVAGVDPIHLTPVYLTNIGGIAAGMLVSSRFILHGTNIRKLLIAGFFCLLLFHVQLYFLFSATAATRNFFLPLFLQGLGTGALFVPIVLYTVNSVPVHLAGSVSFIGIGARFMGFCTSIAISNYFQLFNKSVHYNRFREGITALEPAAAGMLRTGGLNKVIAEQVSLRASMDYYDMMIRALAVFILLLAFLPAAKGLIRRYGRPPVPHR